MLGNSKKKKYLGKLPFDEFYENFFHETETLVQTELCLRPSIHPGKG